MIVSDVQGRKTDSVVRLVSCLAIAEDCLGRCSATGKSIGWLMKASSTYFSKSSSASV